MEWSGAMENWTPGGSSNRVLMAQSGFLANIGWAVFIQPDGRMVVQWSPDGTLGNALSHITTNPPDLELGSEHNIAVTIDVNNGAGGRTVNLLIDDTLFETFTGAVTSIFNTTANLVIGTTGVSPLGHSYCLSAVLRASIGGADVANPDFTIQEVGDTSFADTAGTPKTWTVNAPGAIELVHEGEDLTPRLRWWVMRSIPSAEEVMRILVPLRLFEKEQPPHGVIRGNNFLEELDFLMALSNSKQVVLYQEGLRSYSVYVNNLETNPERWNDMDHGPEGLVLVELFTVTHP
jgi:hypothetical protein